MVYWAGNCNSPIEISAPIFTSIHMNRRREIEDYGRYIETGRTKTLLVIHDYRSRLLNITGWLFHALLALVTAGFILGAIRAC